MRTIRINLDALGMCASSLCMIHCLVFPFLLAALPMLKLSADGADRNGAVQLTSVDSSGVAPTKSAVQCADQECCVTGASGENNGMQVASCCSTPTDYWIHVGLLAAVAPLGIVAWGAGYRQHRRLGVLGLGLTGVLLLSGALLYGPNLLDGRGEQLMTVLGSICMVSAHLWNRRQCQCCRTPDPAGVVQIEGTASETQPVSLSTETAS